MRKILSFLLLFTVLSSAQEKNKQIVDEKSGKQMCIGVVDREVFKDTSYSWWFNSEYENYEPDSSITSTLKAKPSDYSISIIMGTWCGDSKREVPRFIKIVDALGLDAGRLNMICVDRKKECPEIDISGLDIKFVPTFIFYRNGKEIGRIIETPKGKLEQDFLEILN